MAAEEPREASLQVRFISLLWGVMFLGSGMFKMLMLPEQQQLIVSLGFPRWVPVVVP